MYTVHNIQTHCRSFISHCHSHFVRCHTKICCCRQSEKYTQKMGKYFGETTFSIITSFFLSVCWLHSKLAFSRTEMLDLSLHKGVLSGEFRCLFLQKRCYLLQKYSKIAIKCKRTGCMAGFFFYVYIYTYANISVYLFFFFSWGFGLSPWA